MSEVPDIPKEPATPTDSLQPTDPGDPQNPPKLVSLANKNIVTFGDSLTLGIGDEEVKNGGWPYRLQTTYGMKVDKQAVGGMAMSKILTNYNRGVIDLYQRTEVDGKIPASKVAYFSSDNVHLNAAGYNKLAEVIADELKVILCVKMAQCLIKHSQPGTLGWVVVRVRFITIM